MVDNEVLNFERFVEIAEALEKENAAMEEESKKFLENRICPLLKSKCIGIDCAWYIICLNNSFRAFKQFFQ